MTQYIPPQTLGDEAEAGQQLSEESLQGLASPEQQEPVTRKDLEALALTLSEQIKRQLQSLTAKSENRLRKDVDAKVAQLQAMYAELGEPVPENMRELIVQDAVLSRLGSGNEVAQPVPSQEEIRYAMNMRSRLERSYGVTLTEADPEFARVKWVADTPDEHIDSYEEQLKAKAARVRQAQTAAPVQNTPAAQPTPLANPAMRAPTVGSAPASGDQQSRLLAQYNAEKALAKSTAEVIELRAKYRRQGLNI